MAKFLVIAEKPSVAQSLAKNLSAYQREDGYLEGNSCIVSWCLGHLAEYAPPEIYDEKYAKWQFEDLPIIPEVFWRTSTSLACSSSSRSPSTNSIVRYALAPASP